MLLSSLLLFFSLSSHTLYLHDHRVHNAPLILDRQEHNENAQLLLQEVEFLVQNQSIELSIEILSVLENLDDSEQQILAIILLAHRPNIVHIKEKYLAEEKLFYQLCGIATCSFLAKSVVLGKSLLTGLHDIFQFVCLKPSHFVHDEVSFLRTWSTVPLDNPFEVNDICVQVGKLFPDGILLGCSFSLAVLILTHVYKYYLNNKAPKIDAAATHVNQERLIGMTEKLTQCPILMETINATIEKLPSDEPLMP